MMSNETITIIAGIMALKQRDIVVNKIGNSLRNAFRDERISEARIQRILDKFVEELKKI
ncbi:hypothetical protein LGL08_20115 [Clostridium estertheticum]|uniref:hypothetical protein n=1 Tax=Clostridium estertheticum TaxID=238834 RepID=UPI001CF5B166|nr:hypothetical protein [Clostridium estertheticum]MCB2309011.1 hypothetical protein [Clostridium estertheticum]MCB2346855.1 hypothetical protein [Clostridium estertheticum]MCB2351833.1 hypothetical protein [Clostridium estertheticum]WAG48437.1 hypothetical protein LL127_22920 [Clostridium estertheticum]